MKLVNDFHNKLCSDLDNTYFPTLNRNNYNLKVHYTVECYNNGVLGYADFIKKLSKQCKDTQENLHAIVSKYVIDFEGYKFQLWWIIVNSNTNNKNKIFIACKSEKVAENYINKFNNVSDIKVYDVDFYGEATYNEIRDKFNNVDIINANNFKSFAVINQYCYNKIYHN